MLKISHYFFVIAGISLLLGMLFWFKQRNNFLEAKTNQPHKRRRKGDTRKLSKPERKALRKAKILKTKGSPTEAARVLVAAKMFREAIHLLEKSGMIHDAAKILFKLKKPERAAAIFARHQYWQDGANAYKKSNMPREAAKCFEKAGDFENAAESFYKAGMFNESADAAVHAGDIQRAIKVFLAAGQQQKAIDLMVSTVRGSGRDAMPALNSYEQQLIAQHSLHREINAELVELLNQYGRTAEVTAELLRYGDKEKAAFILRRMGKGLVSPVVQKLGTQSSACMTLADLLRELGHFEEAGAVLEQLEVYDRASEAFTMARNTDRAEYCSNKAKELSDWEEQKTIKAVTLTSAPPNPAPTSLPIIPSNFEKNEVTALPPPPIAGLEVEVRKLEPLEEALELCLAMQNLESSDRGQLISYGKEICYGAQETLFDHKLPPAGLMLIVSGYISLFQTGTESEGVAPIHQMPGSLLGLRWVLMDDKESFRAVTSEDTKILVIPKEIAQEYLSTHQAAAASLYKYLCESLQIQLENPSNFNGLKKAS